MEGDTSDDGTVSVTSTDDNLLDGGDEWTDPDEMEPADSDSEGDGYEFVGPEADENWPDTGLDGGDLDLGEVVVSGAESALLANPVTMPAAIAWDAATAATVDDSPVNVVDDAVGTGADAGSEAFLEWQFGDLDGDGRDLGGGGGGGTGSGAGSGDGDGWLPGWAPYAAAGIVALVVLIVLTPYARLGAEVAG